MHANPSRELFDLLVDLNPPVSLNVGGRSFLTRAQTLLQRSPGFVPTHCTEVGTPPPPPQDVQHRQSSPSGLLVGVLGDLLLDKCAHFPTTITTATISRADRDRHITELLVDRDSTNFRYVLNYLRDGANHVVLPYDWYKLQELLLESQYYQLPGLTGLLQHHLDVFPDCCRSVGDRCVPHMSRVGTLRSQFVTARHLADAGCCDLLAFCEKGQFVLTPFSRIISDPSSGKQVVDIEDIALPANNASRLALMKNRFGPESTSGVVERDVVSVQVEGLSLSSFEAPVTAQLELTLSTSRSRELLPPFVSELDLPAPPCAPGRVPTVVSSVIRAPVPPGVPVMVPKPEIALDPAFSPSLSDAVRSLFIPQELCADPCQVINADSMCPDVCVCVCVAP